MSIPADVILPPQEIREVIHKVASFVNKNGDAFELRMKRQEANNPEFGFLFEADPYHRYYLWILLEFQAGNDGVVAVLTTPKLPEQEEEPELHLSDFPEPKPLSFTFRNLPPISPVDLKILKTTALFVAVNGEAYGQTILSQRNATGQYDFLNPSHSFHHLFRLFVDQYTKVASKTLDTEVEALLVSTPETVMRDAFQRAEYNYVKATTSKQEKEAMEHEKWEFSRIDWNDFSVVETIEFTEIDHINELPPPLVLAELQYRSLESRKVGVVVPAPVTVSLDAEAPLALLETEANVEEPETTRHAKPKGIKIRGAGETRLKRSRAVAEPMLECPLTHQMIPEAQFPQHMAILLRDPKYKQERENFERKHHTYGSNLSTDVYTNIQRLARTEEETKRAKRTPVQWDGYAKTANAAQAAASTEYTATEHEAAEAKRLHEQQKIGPVQK